MHFKYLLQLMIMTSTYVQLPYDHSENKRILFSFQVREKVEAYCVYLFSLCSHCSVRLISGSPRFNAFLCIFKEYFANV